MQRHGIKRRRGTRRGRVCRAAAATTAAAVKEVEGGGGKRKRGAPTSNHNLALCRVVSTTLGGSASERVCSFRRIILAWPRVGTAYKESVSIFSRLKFTAGNPAGDVTPALRRPVYSFNLFNARWMLMQMARVKNGGIEVRGRMGGGERGRRAAGRVRGESRIPRSSANAPSETLMNSRTDIFLRLPLSHKCVRTCHRQIAAVLIRSLFLSVSFFSLFPFRNYYTSLSFIR